MKTNKVFLSGLVVLPMLCLALALSCSKTGDAVQPTPQPEPPTPQTANCYIVSSSGQYSFPAVKGNSEESVGEVVTAQVLWESLGTAATPVAGRIVSNVAYTGNVAMGTLLGGSPASPVRPLLPLIPFTVFRRNGSES